MRTITLTTAERDRSVTLDVMTHERSIDRLARRGAVSLGKRLDGPDLFEVQTLDGQPVPGMDEIRHGETYLVVPHQWDGPLAFEGT